MASILQYQAITSFIFQKRVDCHFEKMFETGVNEMAWDDTVRVNMIEDTEISCVDLRYL